MYHINFKKLFAFTLAEVLITLGIIGVVAALTMPSLIENYQKKATAKKLARFYSIMSQAILRWENDEGIIPEDFRFEGTTGTYLEQWFRESIGKYIQTTSIQSTSTSFSAVLNDGSGFDAYTSYNTELNIFYCTEYKYCKKTSREGNFNGKTGFLFQMYKGKLVTSVYSSRNKSREKLLESCKYGNSDNPSVSSKNRRHDCTRLIQMDGWEIKDDYPWKQIMLEN